MGWCKVVFRREIEMTSMTKTTLSENVIGAAREDRAAAMAIFLMQETGSIFGVWDGRMSASDQRILFGKYIGKGHLWVSGDPEEVVMTVKVCFGTDSDTRFKASWAELCAA